jgi:RNA polymerase sigma-70 factor (ECF subfamily)
MSVTNGPNPKELLAEARGGQRDSLGALLELYRNHLQLLAGMQINGRLRSRINPSDLVQETFLKASCHFDDFCGDSEQELLGWLRTILRRCLLRIVQRQVVARKRTILREVALDHNAGSDSGARPITPGLVSAESSPSSPARRREETAAVIERLARLPGPFREVLILRNLEGLPFPEVARQMGRTHGAVRVLWLRALDRLRELSASESSV